MAHKRKDVLWKGAVDEFVEDMLRFFYPGAEELFDFSQSIEFLDPELAQLFPDRDHMKDSIISDRLIKVHSRNGHSTFIYLLMEVHDYHDKQTDYDKRIFSGFCRLFDKYGEGIMALVVYTGSNRLFNPGVFEYSLNTIKLRFEYDVYRVMEQKEEELKKSDNIFAIFIRVVLLAMKKGRVNNEVLLDMHVGLAREITGLGISQDKINELLQFIRLYINFGDRKIDRILEDRINEITVKTTSMNLYEAAVIIKAREAREEAAEETKISLIKKLLMKGYYSAEEIADIAEVAVDFVLKVKDTLPSA